MGYVFAAAGQAVLPVAGSMDLFPVRRVYCVGRNYSAHAVEMGHSARESPFFFAKFSDAVVPVGEGGVGRIPYPPMTADLQFEVELVLALGPAAVRACGGAGRVAIWGCAVGVDLTRRDLQARMKSEARPWEVGKSFDRSAPVSAVLRLAPGAPMPRGRVWLECNGELRQEGDIAQMIWGPEEIVVELGRYFELAPGDLVFTGTPAGIGAVVPGDVLRCGVEGVGEIKVEIIAPAA